MSTSRIDFAAFALRATLGIVLAAHGLLKFFVFTLPGTAQFFASVGFPAWTAYIVAPAEVLAGVALLLGVRSTLIALASLPMLIGAATVHAGNGWVFSNPNGGWEYPVVLVILAASVALLGDGAWALGRVRAREEAATAGGAPARA